MRRHEGTPTEPDLLCNESPIKVDIQSYLVDHSKFLGLPLDYASHMIKI